MSESVRKYVRQYENPQPTYLRNDEWELRESTLHYRGGDYYLHVGVRKTETSSAAYQNADRSAA